MKNLFTILILVGLLFCSCNKQNNVVIKFYPSKRYVQNPNRYPIDLDRSNLKIEDYVSMLTYYSNDKFPYFDFISDSIEYRIAPHPFERAESIMYRNILEISEDSIFEKKGYSIKKLSDVLRDFYENNGKDFNYSDNVNSAFVMLNLNDGTTSSDLKELLLILISKFDKLNLKHNNSLELRILLNYKSNFAPAPTNKPN